MVVLVDQTRLCGTHGGRTKYFFPSLPIYIAGVVDMISIHDIVLSFSITSMDCDPKPQKDWRALSR